MWCKSCDEGDEPNVLDIDGVRSSISGTPGCWAHAYEDDWWPCQRKAAEEHAIVDKLPKTKDGVSVVPGEDVVWHPEVKSNVSNELQAMAIDIDGGAAWWRTPKDRRFVSDCYSTREAAEAARKEGDDAG